MSYIRACGILQWIKRKDDKEYSVSNGTYIFDSGNRIEDYGCIEVCNDADFLEVLASIINRETTDDDFTLKVINRIIKQSNMKVKTRKYKMTCDEHEKYDDIETKKLDTAYKTRSK